jgi:hypothetical protein
VVTTYAAINTVTRKFKPVELMHCRCVEFHSSAWTM